MKEAIFRSMLCVLVFPNSAFQNPSQVHIDLPFFSRLRSEGR